MTCPACLRQGLKLEEVTRVLSPHGTAWLGRSSGGGGGSLTGMTLKTMLINAGLKEFEIIEKQRHLGEIYQAPSGRHGRVDASSI